MTSDADDALSWEGDEDRSAPRPRSGKERTAEPVAALPDGWQAVGKDSEAVGRIQEDGWLLTRRSAGWVRVLGFLAGAALLVPWPFVMSGAVGA
jgi:hypothetical protein